MKQAHEGRKTASDAAFRLGASEPRSLGASEPRSLGADHEVVKAATVDRPETWIPLVRHLAQRYSARRFRDDVTSDSLLAIVRQQNRGRPIDRLAAFATTVVRRLSALAVVRERMMLLLDADALVAPPEPDPFPSGPQFAVGSLRGKRQRWLCRHVLAGWSCERMAQASGLTLPEVRQQVLELCAKILSITQVAIPTKLAVGDLSGQHSKLPHSETY